MRTEDKDKRLGRLFHVARVFRDLIVIAIITAVASYLLLILTQVALYPLYGVSVVVILLTLTSTLLLARKTRERAEMEAPMIFPPGGEEDAVSKLLQQEWKTREVSREVVLEGAHVSHRPDVVFHMDKRTYIGEVKNRPLVPSDIDNARLVLEDIKARTPHIDGVLLFTPIRPSSRVVKMAKSYGVGISVVPELRL